MSLSVGLLNFYIRCSKHALCLNFYFYFICKSDTPSSTAFSIHIPRNSISGTIKLPGYKIPEQHALHLSRPKVFIVLR